MQLKLKEEPKEWRKSALLSALGLAILSTVLRWRHVLPTPAWISVLGLLALIAIFACLQPKWFRGYYRVSTRIGFAISQFIGRALLVLFFIFVLTPFGIVLRLFGKDFLRLKRPHDATSYWNSARESSPLDRLF